MQVLNRTHNQDLIVFTSALVKEKDRFVFFLNHNNDIKKIVIPVFANKKILQTDAYLVN